MESFLQDTPTFEKSWYRVLIHLGICFLADEEKPLRECLKAADVTSPDFDGKARHVTATAHSKESIARLQSVVRALDVKSQHGKASRLENMLIVHEGGTPVWPDPW